MSCKKLGTALESAFCLATDFIIDAQTEQREITEWTVVATESKINGKEIKHTVKWWVGGCRDQCFTNMRPAPK